MESDGPSLHQAHGDSLIRALGVDYGRGFLYAEPLPVDELHRYLADEHAQQGVLAWG